MHIHILGICGTFMGGLAALGRAQGLRVTGQDRAAWPPMSTQLEALGIAVHSGYEPEPLIAQPPDLVVVGNAISRGNPALEYVLERGLPYVSGPQWLAQTVLESRWVLAVAGTHGKTTTSSLIAHILDAVGLEPGFLIGGVPAGFGCSARLGQAPFFVIEADEYDTAFSDKRSKFVHYRPRTLLLNNLEYDHADIFPDLAAIETQFHHLLRTVPGNGLVLYPQGEAALERVLERGCWTPTLGFATAGRGPASAAQPALERESEDWSAFSLHIDGERLPLRWALRGRHNAANALGAVLAARHAGKRWWPNMLGCASTTTSPTTPPPSAKRCRRCARRRRAGCWPGWSCAATACAPAPTHRPCPARCKAPTRFTCTTRRSWTSTPRPRWRPWATGCTATPTPKRCSRRCLAGPARGTPSC